MIRMIFRGVRERGPLGVARAVQRRLAQARTQGILNAGKSLYSKFWFELRYGLVLNGRPKTAAPSPKGHVHYEPVCHFAFNDMMRGVDWNFRESAFLDYGCGKGAAILLASCYGFKKYYGVEYVPELARECDANIERFARIEARIIPHEISCGNATRYEVPRDASVFCFFNPFDETLLDPVMQNIERSLRANNRDVLVLYFNALHKDVMEKYGYSAVYQQAVDPINPSYHGGNFAYAKRRA